MRSPLLTLAVLAPLLMACPSEDAETPTSGPSDPAADPSVPKPDPAPAGDAGTGETGAPAAGETGSPAAPEMACVEALAGCEAKLGICEGTK